MSRKWIEVEGCVMVFSDAMRRKLFQNQRNKGNRDGWMKDSPKYHLMRLKEEVDELGEAVCKMYNDDMSPDEVLNEAADVANIAMMVADSANALDNRKKKAALRGEGGE